MTIELRRIAMMTAGLLAATAVAAADTPAAPTPSTDKVQARRATAADMAALKERFPYRYVGQGGGERGPEFIALTDGSTSFVARVGDVVAERYRITELRATEMILTDLKTRKRRLVLAYKDIQSAPAELTSQGGAGSPTPRSQGTAIAPAASPARSAVAKAAPARKPDPAAADENDEAPPPAADLSAMIAPPPVNRAEQALPMEMLPPPERNPMVVTPPARDIPMITTPSRREHAPTLDIPLGPEN